MQRILITFLILYSASSFANPVEICERWLSEYLNDIQLIANRNGLAQSFNACIREIPAKYTNVCSSSLGMPRDVFNSEAAAFNRTIFDRYQLVTSCRYLNIPPPPFSTYVR